MKQQNVGVANTTKSYKSKIQAFLKLQQKVPMYKDMTSDKILEQFIKSEIQCSNELYNSTIFDQFMPLAWEYQVSKNFLKKIISKQQKLQTILSTTLLILNGYFKFNNIKYQTTYLKVPRVEPFQSFFILSSQDNYKIIFEVGLHKQFIQYQSSDILQFEVIQRVTIIDILFFCSQNEIVDCILEYQRQILKDFNRTQFNLTELKINKTIQLQKQKQQYLFSIDFKNWPESQFSNCNDNLMQFIPITFFPLNTDRNKYIFDDSSKKWVTEQFNSIQMQRSVQESVGNENKYKLKQYADFESADIIQQSPNFKIKISQQERQIISTKNNALVIGRSGTGKTTSIMLRIFATEILLKVRSKIYGQKKLQLLSDLKGNNIVLHQILSTANSFLIQEVEKYYLKLLHIVQEAIDKHRANKTFNLDETFVSEAESEITNYESDVLDFVQPNYEHDYPNFQQDKQYDTQNQKQTNKIENLKFPSFLSTLNLLLLLDSRCYEPYFSKERVQRLYSKHIRQAGFRDCNGINLNEWFQDNLNSSYLQQDMQIIVPEVDFNIFLLNFWPNVAPRHRNIFDNLALPSLVWTQIYSIIKGSQYSYLYPNRALPLTLYKERVQNYLSENQIQEIYQYYLRYEEWKDNLQYYDQLDIVNNLLISFENQKINQYPIHYCYIDEVQDLPQALIELYCKVTEQGIIFCGDTAQSILKGVGFRFSDLQTQFRNSKQIGANEIEKFQIFQLTTNFRSHNNILQFANVLITILELLFPQSIDHLQKEISNLQGPKPIIIANSDPNLILDYLNQQSQGEQQCDIEFGYNQVILVKNEQEKNTLPEALKNARILTVGQAKGLEFDDVVIYNFFTTEPLTEQQWQFLTCIDVNERYVDHQIYDHSVTKHKLEQTEDNNNKKQENKVKVYNLILNDKYQAKKIIDFSSLCNELKLLYVCVTRAKKRVIIYDDEPLRREYLEKILFKQNVCDNESCNAYGYGGQFNNSYRACETKKQVIHQVEPIIQSTPKQQIKVSQIDENEQKKLLNDWNESGHAMFQRKLYDEAIKCFKKAQNDKMRILSEAYYLATKGAQQLAIYQQLYQQYKINKTLELKFQLDQIKEIFQNYFKIAAQQFLNDQINDYIKAADCHYSGQQYTDALVLYLNLNIYQKANKCAKKLKLRYLQVVICLKVGDMFKCLKYLNKYKIDEFFKYDLLKHGFNFGLFDEKFIKEQLLLLSQDSNNIFQQLLLKSLGEDNDTKTKEEIARSFCDEQQFKKLNLQTQFKNEIDKIFNSHIYIDNDLLEMIIEQIKVFFEFYFQILDEKMIINPFNKVELEKCFNTKQYNQHFFDFIQELLEQFNLFELLAAVSNQIRYFYEKYQNSQVIQLQTLTQQVKIQKDSHKQYNNQTIDFIFNLKSNIQTFIIHELIYCRKYQNLLEYFSNQKELKNDLIQSDYQEINQLLVQKQFENQENIIYTVKQYFLFVNIANQFKEQFQNYNFQGFYFKFNSIFEKKSTQFETMIKVFKQIFNNKNNQIEKSLLNKLFDEKQQLKYFRILFLLIYLQDDKNLIYKLFYNFLPDDYFKLFELLMIGQNLFQIEDKIECQKQIFYAISAINGYYILTSQSCNFIGTNLIIKYSIYDQTVTITESQKIIKEIQNLFPPLIEIVFDQLFKNSTKKIFNGKSQWQKTFDRNLEYSKQLKYFLQTNLQLYLQSQHYQMKIGIFKIFQISFLLFKQIPQQLKEITTRNSSLENLKGYIEFKLVCQTQVSLKIIYDWIKYYQSQNVKYIQIKIFEEELKMVILFILVLYQQSISQLNKITYEVRNNFQPYDIIDFEKLQQLQSQQIKESQPENENIENRDDTVQDKLEGQEQEEKNITQEQNDIPTAQQQQHNDLQENQVIQYIEDQQSSQGVKKLEEINQIQNNFEENNNEFKEIESEEKNMLNERNDELNQEQQITQAQQQQQQIEQDKDLQKQKQKVQDSGEQDNYEINKYDEEDFQDLENQDNENNEDKIQASRQQDDLNNKNLNLDGIDNLTKKNENKNMLSEEQEIRQYIDDSDSGQIFNNQLNEVEVKNISQENQQQNEEQIKEQDIEEKVCNIISSEKNQLQIIVNDTNLKDNNQSEQQEKCFPEQLQENQNNKIQVVPLILLNSQQQYLQNMEKSNKYLISLQPEDQNLFSEIVLELINYLLIVINKLDLKIINNKNTNQFMEQLFILIHNLQSQKQQDSDLVKKITQLFQDQTFKHDNDGDDLYSILQVLQFNDQTLIKQQQNSVKKEASLNFTHVEIEEIDTTQFYYDSKKYQQQYQKRDLDYLGIRSKFCKIADQQDNSKHLIYQRIYDLKNKLIGYLSVYQIYSKFKEFLRILQTISDIELDVDQGNNSYYQQQSLDQIEAKLEYFISQKITSEDKKKLQQ